MDWIGSALAFAATMLALSIVVTTSVETIHRFVRLREKGLVIMLRHFYDKVIAPHAGSIGLPAAAREAFLDHMTKNRAPAGETFVSRIWNRDRLGDLPLDDFMGRLGDSPIGDAIARSGLDVGAGAVDTVLRDVAHKFEEFGRDASIYFAARARLLSVVVALVIAWQCYVHPYHLFSTFLRNPTVTAAVTAQAPALLAEFETIQGGSDPSATPNPQRTTAPPRSATPEKGAEAEAADAVANVRERVASLAALGVPIGWTSERLKAAGFDRRYFIVYPVAWTLDSVATIAWLVLGGLLIGLGGPFWRDVLLTMTRLRAAPAEKTAAAEGSTATMGRVTAATDRFMTAMRARGVMAGNGNAEADIEAAVG